VSDIDLAYDLLNGSIDAGDWVKVRKQLEAERQARVEAEAKERARRREHRGAILVGLAVVIVLLALIGGVIGGIVYNAHDERNERIARLDACARGSDPVDICLIRLTGDPDR
jgi:hypothetical protein